MLGSYDPRVNTATLQADRIKHWMSQGAQPSDTVHNLLITHKVIEGKKINVLPKKTVPKKEEAPAPVAAAAAPTAAEVVAEAAPEAPAAAAPTEDNPVAEEKAPE
jgi:small subunit ribosomal protein S16